MSYPDCIWRRVRWSGSEDGLGKLWECAFTSMARIGRVLELEHGKSGEETQCKGKKKPNKFYKEKRKQKVKRKLENIRSPLWSPSKIQEIPLDAQDQTGQRQ